MSDWRKRENQFSGWSGVFREVTSRFFLKHIKSGSCVLDCGAGDGAVSFTLAESGCIVDAIDMRSERIEILEAEKGALKVNGICADFFTYPFDPESYDYVISRQFLPHFGDRWRDVLKRQADICKADGAVIFHHHSAETTKVSGEIAKSPTHKASVERGFKGRGAASKEELSAFCRVHGLVLEAFEPISFFDPRGILYRSGLDKQDRADLQIQMDEWLGRDEVREFACWFEESVVSKLPAGISMSYMAVLRKT